MNLQEQISRIKSMMGLLTEDEGEQVQEEEVFPSKDKAYHLTPDIYLPLIQKEGLVPKAESKISKHAEAIYLFLNPDSNYNFLARDLWLNNKNKNQIQNFYLLEIDLTQLPNHKYYADPESSLSYLGIYTKQSIPPSAIKVIKKISTNEFPAKTPDVELPKLFPQQNPEEIAKEKEKQAKSQKQMDDLMAQAEKQGITSIPADLFDFPSES